KPTRRATAPQLAPRRRAQPGARRSHPNDVHASSNEVQLAFSSEQRQWTPAPAFALSTAARRPAPRLRGRAPARTGGRSHARGRRACAHDHCRILDWYCSQRRVLGTSRAYGFQHLLGVFWVKPLTAASAGGAGLSGRAFVAVAAGLLIVPGLLHFLP